MSITVFRTAKLTFLFFFFFFFKRSVRVNLLHSKSRVSLLRINLRLKRLQHGYDVSKGSRAWNWWKCLFVWSVGYLPILIELIYFAEDMLLLNRSIIYDKTSIDAFLFSVNNYKNRINIGLLYCYHSHPYGFSTLFFDENQAKRDFMFIINRKSKLTTSCVSTDIKRKILFAFCLLVFFFYK